jgi:hypothetical protein
MRKPRIRSVLATPVGESYVLWVCQPFEDGIDDRICGVCRENRLTPFVAECSNCHAAILWDMGERSLARDPQKRPSISNSRAEGEASSKGRAPRARG